MGHSSVGEDAPDKALSLRHRYRVEIFGHSYMLRSDREESYAKVLASMVDQKMRELAARARGGDCLKPAIFAALHLADELCTLTKQMEENDTAFNKRTRALVERIDTACVAFKTKEGLNRTANGVPLAPALCVEEGYIQTDNLKVGGRVQ